MHTPNSPGRSIPLLMATGVTTAVRISVGLPRSGRSARGGCGLQRRPLRVGTAHPVEPALRVGRCENVPSSVLR